MQELMKVVKNGHRDYSPATMWFFNDEITKEEITYQLEEFEKQRIYEFYIHPTGGMKGDYLDDGYFELIRHVVREAERIGLKYWIYDEYNWPSGIAGGYLIKEKPWTRMRNLCAFSDVVQPGAALRKSVPFAEKTKLELLGGVAIKENERTRIEPQILGDEIVWVNNEDVPVTAYIFLTMLHTGVLPCSRGAEFTWNQEGYLDTLDTEAVREFINSTHERYKAEVGEYFGTTLKGVFTDEVAAVSYGSPEMAGMLLTLPWSRKFEQKFKEQRGYDVCDILPMLFIDSDDVDTARARYDYWLTVRDMYINAYMRQVYDWCTDNNLLFTGHGGGEESLRYQLNSFTDMYEIQKYFHMPGIDEIVTYRYIDYYDFNITPKLASSAALFLGRDRLLSETYTLSGWDMSLRHMKRIANRIMLLGVNYIQYMGSTYSMNGHGKGTNGPNHNWQNSLFKHYGDFNKYASSISWIMSNTDTCAQTLVLNPYATARALAGGASLGEGGEHLGTRNTHPLTLQDLTIQGVVNSLFELHIPFEIAYEQVLDNAPVREGRIWMGGHGYDTLILPAAIYVTEGTRRVMTEFAEQGGRLVLLNAVPSADIDTKEDMQISSLLALDNVRVVHEERFDIIDGNKKAKAGFFTKAVRESLEGIPCIVDTQYADGLVSAFRRLGDDLILIYCNDGLDKVTAKGRIHTDKNIYIVSADTGKAKYADIEYEKGGPTFAFELEAFETALVLISNDAPMMPDFTEKTLEISILSTDFSFKPLEKNLDIPLTRIVLDDAALWAAHEAGDTQKLCMLAEALTDEDAPMCIKRSVVNENMESNGWCPPDGIEMPSDKVVGVYDFVLDEIPEKLELISELYYKQSFYLNGKIVDPGVRTRIWSADNAVADITGIVKPGKNRLVCLAELFDFEMTYYMPFAVLRGDFRVYEDVITQKAGGNKPSFWNDQGYRYYAGDGVYECEFYLDKFKKVSLTLETNDVAEVFINGRSAGTRLWNPYSFDLTRECINGLNHLEIVITSTMSNLFGKQAPSGISEAPKLIVQRL
ncbi:MAG: glycosyl hydrolase [Clostridia bacterium]|nr:glycosyl hydrolase [Clostridia bacterium]